MRSTYLVADSIASPLGLGTEDHWQKLVQGISGISLVSRNDITLKNFYASSIPADLWQEWRALVAQPQLTRLEILMVATLKSVEKFVDYSSSKTVFIFSSTKGNIDLMGNAKSDAESLSLTKLAHAVAKECKNSNRPYVVSNACISGLSAILLGESLLKHGKYDQVVICGADLLSEFTVSGFQCLQAISPLPCKPFDQDRIGLSPGEGCGVLVLSSNPSFEGKKIKLAGGASSNDANHISGPSRTGDGLAIAISKAMKAAHVVPSDIGYVSTHGTATLYNDESESKALALAGVNLSPSNSLKGYFGHTYGAAGVIETILSAKSMEKSLILGSIGYQKHGVSTEMNISALPVQKEISYSLKTASGFGSCNAALVLSKA